MYMFAYILVLIVKQYFISEARSHLPTIVDEAEAGVEKKIKRRGKTVAVIVSPRHLERLRSERRPFSDAYSAFLRRFSLEEVGIENRFFSSLRVRDTGRPVEL